jgi:hypothetical protein
LRGEGKRGEAEARERGSTERWGCWTAPLPGPLPASGEREKKMDHAVSTDTAVQTQLDRLWALSPGADILGLERITLLLDRVGNPQDHLPPVFHVAGTNGKGSTPPVTRSTPIPARTSSVSTSGSASQGS